MRRPGLIAVVSGGPSFERAISLGQGFRRLTRGSSMTPRRYLLSVAEQARRHLETTLTTNDIEPIPTGRLL